MASGGGSTRTGVDVCNYYFRALVREQPRRFGADSLSGAGDDGDLAGEHAGRVVEVLVDLVETIGGSHCDVMCEGKVQG